MQNRRTRSLARDSSRRKHGEQRAKTLTSLEKSSRLRLCRVKIERRRDFFAADGAKASETAKFEPRNLLWGASFCLILFFFDAGRRVTLAPQKFSPRRSGDASSFRFFYDGGGGEREKSKNGGSWPPFCMAGRAGSIKRRACGAAPATGKSSARPNFYESHPAAPPA
ncbi:MAG TPA: hypothetical protein VEH75_04440 [Xanthobacteraceae bacterium]|nr:hypothetical protein [Xanthobacteraceae bacterium]